MATKDELRRDIKAIEPDNSVANGSSASHADLRREMAAVNRRRAAREASEAIQVVLRYRVENEVEMMSWRFFIVDDDGPMDGLHCGCELPTVGTLMVLDDVTCRVSGHEPGLAICAGDLSLRETFDPRRKYTTPNESVVTFKRLEGPRVVLWSYRTQQEIALGPHVELMRTDLRAKPVAATKRRNTQKILAAWAIAQNPMITGLELTELLRSAFPHAKISDRHGPHYLSHSRHGRLPEPPDTDPRIW